MGNRSDRHRLGGAGYRVTRRAARSPRSSPSRTAIHGDRAGRGSAPPRRRPGHGLPDARGPRGAGRSRTARSAVGEHAYVGCEPGHHHHVVCSGCGRTTRSPTRACGRSSGRSPAGRDIRVDEHRLELFGLCPGVEAGGCPRRKRAAPARCPRPEPGSTTRRTPVRLHRPPRSIAAMSSSGSARRRLRPRRRQRRAPRRQASASGNPGRRRSISSPRRPSSRTSSGTSAVTGSRQLDHPGRRRAGGLRAEARGRPQARRCGPHRLQRGRARRLPRQADRGSGRAAADAALVLGDGIPTITVDGEAEPALLARSEPRRHDHYLPAIAAKLRELDPAGAATYAANAAAYARAARRRWTRRADGQGRHDPGGGPQARHLPRRIPVLRPALRLRARRGDPAERRARSRAASDLAALVDTVKAADVKAVFSEAQFSPELARDARRRGRRHQGRHDPVQRRRSGRPRPTPTWR